MSDLEQAPTTTTTTKINPELLKISKVLGENPEDYTSNTCQQFEIGTALNARKGDLVSYFDSNKAKTGKSWTLNIRDIDVLKYKQSLWTTVKHILEAAKYPVNDLAVEFGLLNVSSNKRKKRSKKHSNNIDTSGQNKVSKSRQTN